MMKIKKYFIGLLFFLSACASGSSLVEKNVIKPGMTKLDLNFVLAYRSFWDQVAVPLAYREYFVEQ